ncbi:5'-methylthioadenosine/S-adenosylhomocysteine nucleosidase family protein [Nonomuraea jabiensis]|uniref:Adenosylhomocysteine nucleosidase n=1 Tax=Nonomuraea jabiensis TaxID=882448 RepID=A0A7W9FXR9_9ACTN|nr:5'-methylthioadenosine/S-adenosylhomocysteine nucleosidase [Nonomuraea jabiensis]MBB5773505.1 adenosylhomocysteine nucleosidase [Nonomuraea jabiensis]
MTQQRVDGILNYRGTMTVRDSAVGSNAKVVRTAPSPRAGAAERVQVGVITILPLETQAVRLALGLRSERVGDLTFYRAAVDGVSVAATSALEPGQRSAMAAYNNLVGVFDPEIAVLVGIGGGVHESVAIGDVVLATEMVYYDLRKVTPSGTPRRGETRPAPAAVGHAVNAFLTDLDQPSRLAIEDPEGTSRSVAVHAGPIGSGEAVIADEDAAEIAFLASFNDKILAVDMEAGGLGQACHERSAASGRQHRWMVVRGISDHADRNKSDAPQRVAAWHAAQVLRRLLPYLKNDR